MCPPPDLLQYQNSADGVQKLNLCLREVFQLAVSYLSQKVWRQGRTLGVR